MDLKPNHIRAVGWLSCAISIVVVVGVSLYAVGKEAEATGSFSFLLFALLSSMSVLNIPLLVGYREFHSVGSSGWSVQWLIALLFAMQYVVVGIFGLERIESELMHIVPVSSIVVGAPHLVLLPLYMMIQFESKCVGALDKNGSGCS